jgi:GTP cyclohydrolase II
LTGEVFHSLRCDCRKQLDLAFDRIAAEECGVIVYLRQEGRGIGLGNKVRAYALQDQGHDTVDANVALGFEVDSRSYDQAAEILRDLELASVRLLTNNPLKLEGLTRAGVVVSGQELHWVGESEHNAAYLAAKKARMGHLDDMTPPPAKKATGQ